jgi:hypothetical protein
MQRQVDRGEQHLSRIQFVGRVQAAYEDLCESVRRHERSANARAAVAAAKERFNVLNRALALLALEAT